MTERQETWLISALSKLDAEIDVPAIDPARAQALLDAFDAHWDGRRRAPRRWTWAAAAAMAAVTVTLGWFGVHRAPRTVSEMADRAVDVTGFVPWPGAQTLPPLESGELVRIGLPVSALPALGLAPPTSAVAVVQADIVVGQDGFARAVRLVQ
jgi:hypothetical protein